MSAIRLFVNQHIHANKLIKLNLQQIHYLKDVMRSKNHQSIIIFNKNDGEWSAIIESSYKHSIEIKVLALIKAPIIEQELCLCFSLVKWKALSKVIRQATELGVTKLQPVLTDYTVVRTMNSSKLEACAIEAAEQSERITVPNVMELITFHDMCMQYKNTLVICDESDRNNNPWDILTPMSTATLMIGPEGGFSPHELDYQGVQRMNLGKQILRVDTAVVAALTYLKAFLGRAL